jgi:hypothetical protein
MSSGNRDSVRSISVATAGSLPGSSPTSDQNEEVGDGAHDKMMMKAPPRAPLVFPQHAVVNGAVGERPLGVPLPRRIFQRPKQRTLNILAVASGLQVIVGCARGPAGCAGT